jgi:4-amino-4-deoxy-L-arabinose transferase-like glycosyltransferase
MSNIPLTGHSSEQGGHLLRCLLWVALAFLICSIILLSLVPPVSKDELVHHLALPKLYLKHGGMYEIPFMPFSYYPMNLQLLYMIPLYFGNDIVPKLMHFTFGLLTAWLIFAYLRSRTTTLYGLLGALLFLSIPVIVKLSTTAYVDLGVVFFTTASLLLLFKWADKGFKLKYLAASALSCGLAMGTKYSALICFFLLTLAVPFINARFTPRTKVSLLRSVRFTLIFFFVATLAFSPWMIRNYSWTKNPLHPLFAHWFQQQTTVASENSGPDSESQSGLGVFSIRKGVYHETGWQMALVPIRVFFEGRDGSPQHFDGKLNPFLILLPFFAFYRAREAESLKKEKMILLAFSVFCFGFAFFTVDLRIRYISAIIPPLVILSVLGAKGLSSNLVGFLRKRPNLRFSWAFLVLALPIAYNAPYLVNQFAYVDPFRYLSGELSRDEYIARFRPEYDAMKFVNESLPEDAKVLFAFMGDRGYYCEKDYFFGESVLGRVFQSASAPEEISFKLKETGATHLLIYHHLFEKWMRENFRGEKEKLLRKFFEDHVRYLFFRHGFSVSYLKVRRDEN